MQKISVLLLSLSLILNACGSSDVTHPELRSQPLTIALPSPPCTRGDGFILEAPHLTGETDNHYQSRVRAMLQRYGVTRVEFYVPALSNGFYVQMTDTQAQQISYDMEISSIEADAICPLNSNF